VSVGTRTLDAGGVPVRLFYPTRVASRPETFGPYAVDVAIDAPLDGAGHPQVVVSHGGTSSPWVLRDLAISLVRAGCVVALPTHPGDNRDDRSLFGTVANLEQRPRHLRQVIDALGAARVAVIGHSMGGYTALAVAGGRPVALPSETADGRAHPVSVVRDPRVRALVLLAPATAWFMGPGALDGVDVPVQLWTGELDAMAPEGFTQIVLRGVAGVDHRRIPNAGHFAFVSPFPPAMTSPSFPPSQDPPGFDRAAFQPVLHAAIADFLAA
jgi:predicted dienelactone hydrolase